MACHNGKGVAERTNSIHHGLLGRVVAATLMHCPQEQLHTPAQPSSHLSSLYTSCQGRPSSWLISSMATPLSKLGTCLQGQGREGKVGKKLDGAWIGRRVRKVGRACLSGWGSRGARQGPGWVAALQFNGRTARACARPGNSCYIVACPS